VNFEKKIAAFDVRSGETAPEIILYYNSLSDGFIELYGKITTNLTLYEKSVSKKFDINRSGGGDMAQAGDSKRPFLAAILPMFLIVFIFHGAIAASTEAITGEKERGTLATLLITPTSTIELALGKIFALSIESFLCGISGALGILLSLPKFIASLNSKLSDTQGLSTIAALGTINISQYTIDDLAVLILVLLSGSCFIVTFIAIVSIYAKTAKEAQMLLSPMFIIFMLISLLSAFNNSNAIKEIPHYVIPVYNSVQCMNDIFSKSCISKQIVLTIGSNFFLSAVGSVALSRLFKNEKITAAS
jgi:sodium transport system permease protein